MKRRALAIFLAVASIYVLFLLYRGTAGDHVILEPSLTGESDPLSKQSTEQPVEGTKEKPDDEETAASDNQLISSISTADGKFFKIDFGGDRVTINPNILPHPTEAGVWIVVAQLMPAEVQPESYEIVCRASFQGPVLQCLEEPVSLPVEPTSGANCEGQAAVLNLSVGPHDARVLFGPDRPFIVFGSNSRYTCFGQFAQDFTALTSWWPPQTSARYFETAVELQRPEPYGHIEKNWFLFWDSAGDVYVHYDIAPKRLFAKIETDGSMSPGFTPPSSAADDACLSKFLPDVSKDEESIHQATNALRVTMCKRTDASCVPSDENTFIFTIVQHKKFYDLHSEYEPYVVVFRQSSPFAVHGVSRKPLWISGREAHPETHRTDMFFVTSINWKNVDRKYHGYLDDELFLAFGIEDRATGGIDLTAETLLSQLASCLET